MTASRREVLIGGAAALATANVTAFPPAIAKTLCARSPLTSPPRVMIRYPDNLRGHMMSSFFYVRKPDFSSSPEGPSEHASRFGR